eukprot:6176430-Pleurochrysis_carterae.AAC.1
MRRSSWLRSGRHILYTGENACTAAHAQPSYRSLCQLQKYVRVPALLVAAWATTKVKEKGRRERESSRGPRELKFRA